jgi:hypothetical protein
MGAMDGCSRHSPGSAFVEDVEKGHSDFLMFGCGEVDLHKSVQIDDRRLRND